MCASLPSSPPTAIWVASAAKQQPCSDSNQTNLLILQFLFPNKECVSDFPEQVDFRFAESFFSFYFSSEWENSFSQSWVVFFGLVIISVFCCWDKKWPQLFWPPDVGRRRRRRRQRRRRRWQPRTRPLRSRASNSIVAVLVDGAWGRASDFYF